MRIKSQMNNERLMIAIMGTDQGLIRGRDGTFSLTYLKSKLTKTETNIQKQKIQCDLCTPLLDIGQQAWENSRPIAKGL